MADYLTRLGMRAIGAAPALRPRIAPRFAPPEGEGEVAEMVPPAPKPRPPAELPAQPVAPLPRVVAEEKAAPKRETAEAPSPAPKPETRVITRVEETKVPVVREVSTPVPVVKKEREVITRDRVFREEAEAPKPHVDTIVETREVPRDRDRIVVRAAPPAPPSVIERSVAAPPGAARIAAVQVPDTRHPTPAEPAIRVTIGRVEVRATPPVAPARQAPKTQAPMSLDDYLARRNGKERA